MAKTLLVPLDGTDASARALPAATVVADRFGADVVLVAVELAGSPQPPDPAWIADVASTSDARVEVIASTEVAEALDALVADTSDPVVCMATHARAFPGRAWFGSVAESVLRGLDVPIVLVGPRFDRRWTGTGRILAALDGSEAALDALATAVAWDGILGAGITVVHVAHPLDVSVAPDPVIDAACARFPGVDLGAQVIRSREPEWEVIDLARRCGASFVVCSTHGRSGVGRAVMGSVAMGVVRRAPCPVLVRPARHEAQRHPRRASGATVRRTR